MRGRLSFSVSVRNLLVEVFMIVAKRLALMGVRLLMVGGTGSPALAWGDLGHKAICEMAYRRVSPATRAEIDKLIRTDPEYSLFADACTWADLPRKRPAEHFVNLARDAQGLTTHDCPGDSPCVVRPFARTSRGWHRRLLPRPTNWSR
jgi:hypothetical protein